MQRFAGKVACITGAASGIGRAVAIRLAGEGAGVFGVDLDGDGLARTASTIEAAGGTMRCAVADVSRREQCHRAVVDCAQAFGRLDVLGNVAGISGCRHVADVTEQEWDRMLAVNVSGSFWMAQAAIPHLLAVGGNIVNITSNAGLMGQAYTVPYCVSKGAVIQLTRALALEFVKQPLRVNAIAPGAVNTELAAGFEFLPDLDPQLTRRWVPLRGLAEAEDVAALFAFLASDEARNVHGAIVTSDGGLTAG